ncbi:MAG: DM13 domain-containing protein [Caldilineaceae bacterium]
MNRRTLYIILVILVVVIGAPVAWWLGSPLFISQQVNEEFPFALPSQSELAAMSMQEKEGVVATVMAAAADEEAMDAMPAEQKQQMEEIAVAASADMPDKMMDDAMPAAEAEWVVAAHGQFMDADSFHKGSGTATIYQQGDQRVLRFEDFESTNGPDLHVLLVENVTGDMGEYVDLGSLKGNIGNQNYEIPSDVDLSKFSGVMIYCMPFHVVFSTAAF